MARKRGLDGIELEDTASPDTKRQKVPALASVIVEALKVDSLQKLCSSLEPILRRVVSEEVERALAKVAPARIGGRSSPKRIEGPEGRRLQLQFTTRLSLPLFTGGKVEGEHGAAIHVILRDSSTGLVITSGPESSAKLDILVLEGDFNNEDEDGWTEEEFENFVVKEREGKRPLLTGDLQVTLKEGVGTLGHFTFTDNSSWIRSRKFRLGLRVAKGFLEGLHIREAKTDAFTVKDHRGELYKKHYPPALTDEVWRLEKIGKDGAFHKRLNKASIYNVEDFLRFVIKDPKELRNILGSGMSNKMWDILVEHAKTCILTGKLYVYYSDATQSVGAIFNNIYEFCGLMADGQYYSAETLSDGQKLFVDALVKKAYDNWMHVVEYDGTDISKHMARLDASGAEDGVGPSNYSYDQQVSLPHIQSSLATEQAGHINSSLFGGFVAAGYDNNAAKYTSHALDVAPNAHNQLESTSYSSQDQFVGSSQHPQVTRNDSTSLALGLPRGMGLEVDSPASSMHNSTSISYDDWSNNRDNRGYPDFFSEEEIRERSHEILENEDMQHLLRVFSMGGATPNLPDDGFTFPSYMPTPTPNFNFDEDRGRSGKAFVGWLKIKAAMRWGIFIRKKAAARRAQLVELDD